MVFSLCATKSTRTMGDTRYGEVMHFGQSGAGLYQDVDGTDFGPVELPGCAFRHKGLKCSRAVSGPGHSFCELGMDKGAHKKHKCLVPVDTIYGEATIAVREPAMGNGTYETAPPKAVPPQTANAAKAPPRRKAPTMKPRRQAPPPPVADAARQAEDEANASTTTPRRKASVTGGGGALARRAAPQPPVTDAARQADAACRTDAVRRAKAAKAEAELWQFEAAAAVAAANEAVAAEEAVSREARTARQAKPEAARRAKTAKPEAARRAKPAKAEAKPAAAGGGVRREPTARYTQAGSMELFPGLCGLVKIYPRPVNEIVNPALKREYGSEMDAKGTNRLAVMHRTDSGSFRSLVVRVVRDDGPVYLSTMVRCCAETSQGAPFCPRHAAQCSPAKERAIKLVLSRDGSASVTVPIGWTAAAFNLKLIDAVEEQLMHVKGPSRREKAVDVVYKLTGLSPARQADLPEGWESAVCTETGRPYYYKVGTSRTTWVHPGTATPEPAAAQPVYGAGC